MSDRIPPDPDDDRDPFGRDPAQPDPLGAGSEQAREPRRGGFLRRLFGGDPGQARWGELAEPEPGVAEYAADRGWTVRPDDEPDELAEHLLAAMPAGPGPKYRPANVVYGRTDPDVDSVAAVITGSERVQSWSGSVAGGWDFVAFDGVYDDGRYREVRNCLTALSIPLPLPRLRLIPSRFPLRGGSGLLILPGDDEDFTGRWRLLSAQDTALARAVAGPTVRAALLASPDIDEVWTDRGSIVAARLDEHTPETIRWHLALLTAIVDDVRQSLAAE